MKRTLLTIPLLSFLLVIPAFAADSNGTTEKITYKVILSATYNEVSAEEATRIVADFLKRHDGACKNKIVVEKNRSQDLVGGSSLFFDYPQHVCYPCR